MGTGKQGVDKEGGKEGTQQEIASPWDVVVAAAPGTIVRFSCVGNSQSRVEECQLSSEKRHHSYHFLSYTIFISLVA